ncbi:MAG: hypothetical protein APR63_10005 [Desulfuromonas sp. SDB]|nr:MAG: hypothetical protein APR63_10005 [Desulfuromonas sp. SDB]
MNLKDFKPKQRFSTKARYYENRLDYPDKIIEILKKEIDFNSKFTIADIGSGTGKLSLLFIPGGNLIYAIEPNREMMKLAVSSLKSNNNFQPILACAEQTGLADESVDLICIGQAFHWFDKQECYGEFKRILKNPGYLAIFGKKSDFVDKVLNEEYLAIFDQLCPKPEKRPNYDDEDVEQLFSPFKPGKIEVSENIRQTSDRIIKGTLSYSYAPDGDCPEGLKLVEVLEECLNKYSVDGFFETVVRTKITVGQIK